MTLSPILVFSFYPSDIEKLEIIAKKLYVLEPNLWWDPIKYTSNPFLSAVVGESKFMFSEDKMGSYKHLFQYPQKISFAYINFDFYLCIQQQILIKILKSF